MGIQKPREGFAPPIQGQTEVPIQSFQIALPETVDKQVIEIKGTGPPPILGELHPPEDPKIVDMGACAGRRMNEPIGLDGEGEGAVHVAPEVLQAPATARIKAKGFEDGIHAEFHMVVERQVPGAIEEQHIEIAGEAWSRHAFRGADGQKGAVVIVDMQRRDGGAFAGIAPERKVAEMAFHRDCRRRDRLWRESQALPNVPFDLLTIAHRAHLEQGKRNYPCEKDAPRARR
jgi:hypothetical protein